MIDKYLTKQKNGSIVKKEDEKVPCENLKKESKTAYYKLRSDTYH